MTRTAEHAHGAAWNTGSRPQSWTMPTRCSAAACSIVAALLALVLARRLSGGPTALTPDDDRSDSNPYKILGVPNSADHAAVTKAYRNLAKKWHPDRSGGDKAVFSTIAHAYEVLTDPEKREVLDRLGESGLERLRDGDPSVRKDYLPPDEVLRRIHNDGDQAWLDAMVTQGFAAIGSLVSASQQFVEPVLFGVAEALGVDSRTPTVRISAAASGSGAALASGGRATEGVTFKFSLSGKSFDFDSSDVAHTGCEKPHFLGMKTTFYLQCRHSPGADLSVSVPANAFTVTGRQGSNMASEIFTLSM